MSGTAETGRGVGRAREGGEGERNGGGNGGARSGWRRRREGRDRREERHEAEAEGEGEGLAANRAQLAAHRLANSSSSPSILLHLRQCPTTLSSHSSDSPPDPTPPNHPARSRPHHSPTNTTSTLPSPPPSSSPATASASASSPPLPTSTSSSSSTATSLPPGRDARMIPTALLPLLHCPLCSPPALLRAPVTLQCGHSFCAAHFPSSNAPSTSKAADAAPVLPACPLPTCSSSSSSSRAPASFTHAPPLDVTVNRLIDVLTAVSVEEEPPPHSFHDDSDDRTDSEYDADSDSDLEYLPLPPPSPESPPPAQHPSSSVRDSDAVEHVTRPSSPRVNPNPRSRSRSHSPSSPRLHPRKRRRRLQRPVSASPPQPHSQTHRTDHDREGRIQKELLSELTCEICFGLLWQPITTPCQHTFCTRCLFRSLDHSQTCPLCRQRLPGYDYFQQHPCNKVILAIILKAFPDAYAERGATIEAEEHDARLDTPIFVCQLSFPGMPTMLHFFEPRYRLMLRRCLESPNPCFGMIPPPRAAPSSSSSGSSNTGNEYGTMLAIRNVHMLPDGRSLVETWGTWRFRIMERGTLDGYTVARIERIEDYEEELDDSAGASEEANDSRLGDGVPQAEANEEVAEPVGDSTPGTRDSPAREDLRPLEAAVSTELGGAVADAQTASSSSSRSHTGAIHASLSTREASTLPTATEPRNARCEETDTAREKRTEVSDADPSSPSLTTPRAPTNAELMARCHAFIDQMRQGTPWVVQHLNNNYVPMPNDAASFSFWMALLLPIDEHEKAKLLPIRSPRLRLRLVVHWIEQLNSNWARAYASASAWQVVLWRMRRLLMPAVYAPRAVRLWAWLGAYIIMLAAVYVAQAGWHTPDNMAAVGDRRSG